MSDTPPDPVPVTEEQYKQAIADKLAAESTIGKYHRQEGDAFQVRLASGVPFTDDELVYSMYMLCPCGYGLAYPKDCNPGHYWDCSAILKGAANPQVEHTGRLPFAFYDVKAEGEDRTSNRTTRGVFRPGP